MTKRKYKHRSNRTAHTNTILWILIDQCSQLTKKLHFRTNYGQRKKVEENHGYERIVMSMSMSKSDKPIN